MTRREYEQAIQDWQQSLPQQAEALSYRLRVKRRRPVVDAGRVLAGIWMGSVLLFGAVAVYILCQ